MPADLYRRKCQKGKPESSEVGHPWGWSRWWEEFRRDWPFFEFILLYNLDFQKFVDVLHIENINQKNGGG